MAHKLAGKCVLIAGRAKNLGGLLVDKLAEAGVAYVAVHHNSSKSQSAAEETKAKMEARGLKSIMLRGDLTTGPTMTTLFADAAVGRIDLAVNTIGMVLKSLSLRQPTSSWI